MDPYDGTSWTELNDLNSAVETSEGAGTQTAGIAIGGSPRTAVVEQYNGSAWTELEICTARHSAVLQKMEDLILEHKHLQYFLEGMLLQEI